MIRIDPCSDTDTQAPAESRELKLLSKKTPTTLNELVELCESAVSFIFKGERFSRPDFFHQSLVNSDLRSR